MILGNRSRLAAELVRAGLDRGQSCYVCSFSATSALSNLVRLVKLKFLISGDVDVIFFQTSLTIQGSKNSGRNLLIMGGEFISTLLTCS